MALGVRMLQTRRFKAFKWISPFLAPVPFPMQFLLRISDSDKESNVHQYGRTYGRLFRTLKYRPITLLEIGIGGYEGWPGGASLNAWRFFFPFAKIVACDIVDKRAMNGGRVHIHVVDQSSADDLAVLSGKEGPFDVVIDDGSHINAHQIFSFENLFSQLKAGGLYIIEDTLTSYWPEYGGTTVDQQSRITAMGYFTELARYLNYPDFRNEQGDPKMTGFGKSISSIYFEHNLIVITKVNHSGPKRDPAPKMARDPMGPQKSPALSQQARRW